MPGNGIELYDVRADPGEYRIKLAKAGAPRQR
jgi:hypothetical protein